MVQSPPTRTEIEVVLSGIELALRKALKFFYKNHSFFLVFWCVPHISSHIDLREVRSAVLATTQCYGAEAEAGFDQPISASNLSSTDVAMSGPST